MLCCDQVAVFGLGNAAFETANALAPVVDYVHVFPGRKAASLPLVSWETRYPVRAQIQFPSPFVLVAACRFGFIDEITTMATK